MYMDYAPLWKQLIDRNLTKTDLCEMTGINTRVIAKMAKNETVTTDTVARICGALHCRVEDIMECADEANMSFWAAYRRIGRVVEENERYRTVRFTHGGQKYVVYVTVASANKGTEISCREDDTVWWVQYYPLGGPIIGSARKEWVLIKPKRQNDEIAVVLIRGKPGAIQGLDEGIFVRSVSPLRTKRDVYVMSERACKLFQPTQAAPVTR